MVLCLNAALLSCLTFICLAGLMPVFPLGATADERTNKECIGISFGYGSTVCVCNRTYCDEPQPTGEIPDGKAVLFQSTQDGLRFHRFLANWTSAEPSVYRFGNESDVQHFHVDSDLTFQEILGFGGAFTDSVGINLQQLPTEMQESIMRNYFADTGLRYNLGRVPMASCDFSTHEYSYDDFDGDFNLTNFNLTSEDLIFKIPYIKRAKELASEQLFLFASPWSSPAWMKTNGHMNGKGTLKGSPGGAYYKTWANYFLNFLKAYEAHNISFWGLTAQNEPTSGFVKGYPFQTLGFTAQMQRDFIKTDLGPTLSIGGYGHLKLIILDDQRYELPHWAETVLEDAAAAQYVSGIGVHWYWDWLTPARALDHTHQEFPDYFLLATEACTGWLIGHGVRLGSWVRAQDYAYDIIEDLNHWVTGWVDWNLALDRHGGPNWSKNFVDSPVIVNAAANEFYKQPMYYAIGHFSRFLPRGSAKIFGQFSRVLQFCSATSFRTPDGHKVVVALNRRYYPVGFVLTDRAAPGKQLSLTLPAYSITTIVYKTI